MRGQVEKINKIWVVSCANGKVGISEVTVDELTDNSKKHYQEVLGLARGKIHEDKDRGVTWDFTKLRAYAIAKEKINENLKYLQQQMGKASSSSNKMWGIVRGTGGVFVKNVRTGGISNEKKVYEAAIAEVQQNLSELNRGEYSAIGKTRR